MFAYSYSATNLTEDTAETIPFPPACHARLRLWFLSCVQIEIGSRKITIAISSRPSYGLYIFLKMYV